ncbi:ABC transporter permease [Roseomonas chloroacetimidivorans]|uniref:ABC transporter permease n=1 Tax=Roseomonas chloroacetimidivorans TaxID=1766656 RepID=UPI003C74D7D1
MSGVGTLPEPPARRERGHWLVEGIATQMRVVGALIMREMQTRFGRHNLGFLWMFFEPLFLGTMVGLIHYAHGQRLPGGVDPFVFSIVGYVPFFMFRSIVNRAGAALHSNLTLLFHRQVTPVDVMIARNLLEAAAVFGVIAIILTVAAWIGDIWPESPGLIFVALVLSFLLCHGLSMLLAAAVSHWEGFDRMIHPITYLLMPLSGAFYALHWFPPSLRELLLWNPLVSIHEAIREGMFGHRLPSYYDLPYVGLWILGTNLLGLASLRTARRKLNVF